MLILFYKTVLAARGLAVLPAVPHALRIVMIRRVIVHFVCYYFGYSCAKVNKKSVDSPKSTDFLIIYFVGTFSNAFFSNSQKGATVSISARSLVVWGDFIVGPNETTSRCGYLPRITEHSNPAWSTWMMPSFPNSSLYSFNNRCRMEESGLGSQPP